MAKERPRGPARMSGQWPALALAIVVHVAFVAVLVFSLRWQNRKPEPVTVELYAPPPKVRGRRAGRPVRPLAAAEAGAGSRTQAPEPKLPNPSPSPSPNRPRRRSRRSPSPRSKNPIPARPRSRRRHGEDEEERKKREQAVREKKEREKKEADQQEAEKKKRDEQQRMADARERQAREAEALRAQAEREQAARAVQQKADAEAAARARAEADYVRRIQSKVKGNVVLPPDMAGNPEAIFDVIQLPTGEIIDAVLRKSSGSRAYDDAVQRAIVKSSPLPRPDRPDLFQRTLTLKFRPQD